MAKTPKSGKKKPATLEGTALFRAVMTDAVQLDVETRRRYVAEAGNTANKPSAEPGPGKVKPAPQRKQAARLGGLLEPVAGKKTPVPAKIFDRVTLRQVKQGKIEIDGRLDLHGMTQAQAHNRLTGFISSSARAGKRCVLVITGKGAPVGGREPRAGLDAKVGGGIGRGILRQMTPNWLAGADLSPYVVDFQAALPRHGGAGALYVRLRRPK